MYTVYPVTGDFLMLTTRVRFFRGDLVEETHDFPSRMGIGIHSEWRFRKNSGIHIESKSLNINSFQDNIMRQTFGYLISIKGQFLVPRDCSGISRNKGETDTMRLRFGTAEVLKRSFVSSTSEVTRLKFEG